MPGARAFVSGICAAIVTYTFSPLWTHWERDNGIFVLPEPTRRSSRASYGGASVEEAGNSPVDESIFTESEGNVYYEEKVPNEVSDDMKQFEKTGTFPSYVEIDTEPGFQTIPNEITLEIFQSLSLRDLLRMGFLNKDYVRVVSSLKQLFNEKALAALINETFKLYQVEEDEEKRAILKTDILLCFKAILDLVPEKDRPLYSLYIQPLQEYLFHQGSEFGLLEPANVFPHLRKSLLEFFRRKYGRTTVLKEKRLTSRIIEGMIFCFQYS